MKLVRGPPPPLSPLLPPLLTPPRTLLSPHVHPGHTQPSMQPNWLYTVFAWLVTMAAPLFFVYTLANFIMVSQEGGGRRERRGGRACRMQ